MWGEGDADFLMLHLTGPTCFHRNGAYLPPPTGFHEHGQWVQEVPPPMRKQQQQQASQRQKTPMPSRSPWTTIAKGGKRRQAQELVLTADEQKTLTRSLLESTPREMEFHAQKRTEATCGVMALRNALQPMKGDMVHDAQMRICAEVLEERIMLNNDPSAMLNFKMSGALCDENGNYHELVLGLWTEFNLGSLGLPCTGVLAAGRIQGCCFNVETLLRRLY